MRRIVFLILASLLLTGVCSAQSPPSVSSVVDAQRQVKDYSSAVISPDGTRVAWVERIEDRGTSSLRFSAVWSGPRGRRQACARDGRLRRKESPRGRSRLVSGRPEDGVSLRRGARKTARNLRRLRVGLLGPAVDESHRSAFAPRLVARREVDRLPLRRRLDTGARRARGLQAGLRRRRRGIRRGCG